MAAWVSSQTTQGLGQLALEELADLLLAVADRLYGVLGPFLIVRRTPPVPLDPVECPSWRRRFFGLE
jgi:hypothetical protein